MRITVNTPEAAAAVPRIRERLDMMGVDVPLIGDFHYNGHQLLEREPACAEALAKYRINPGNVGFGKKRDTQFATIIEFALKYAKPVRIGANWGSLDQSMVAALMDENHARAEPWDAARVAREALIRSALDSAARAEELGLGRDRIILSCKVSGVQELIAVYRDLAARCDYALHLGLTEAGMGSQGHRRLDRRARRAAAGRHRRHHPHLADAGARRIAHARSHRRAGTAADDGPARVHAAGHRLPRLRAHDQRRCSRSWPRPCRTTCARRCRNGACKYDGVENLTLAVMGCVVNGPGESQARQHRHLAARHRRSAGRAGVHRWREGDDAARRQHRQRIRRRASRTTWRASTRRVPAEAACANCVVGPAGPDRHGDLQYVREWPLQSSICRGLP